MGFGIPLTGVDIVKMLEDMLPGSRLSHTKLDDIVAASHHAKTVAGELNLAGLAEKAHGSLTGVTSDLHHAQAHTHTLLQDVIGDAVTTDTSLDATGSNKQLSVAAGADSDLVSRTLAFAAISRAVAAGFINAYSQAADKFKMRLYMAGVQVAESAYMGTTGDTIALVGTRALSGSQICKIAAHNYDGALQYFRPGSAKGVGGELAIAVGVGSIKV